MFLSIQGCVLVNSHSLSTPNTHINPIVGVILEIVGYQWLAMGRIYYDHLGLRIYEIAFPIGDAPAYFCIINGDRHYFKTLFAAKSYITRLSEDQKLA